MATGWSFTSLSQPIFFNASGSPDNALAKALSQSLKSPLLLNSVNCLSAILFKASSILSLTLPTSTLLPPAKYTIASLHILSINSSIAILASPCRVSILFLACSASGDEGNPLLLIAKPAARYLMISLVKSLSRNFFIKA